MNIVYRDQIARKLSAAFNLKSGWDDTNGAEKALEWFITYIKGLLSQCPQTEETGLCDMTWKHADCAAYMSILYDLTGNDIYITRY